MYLHLNSNMIILKSKAYTDGEIEVIDLNSNMIILK